MGQLEQWFTKASFTFFTLPTPNTQQHALPLLLTYTVYLWLKIFTLDVKNNAKLPSIQHSRYCECHMKMDPESPSASTFNTAMFVCISVHVCVMQGFLSLAGGYTMAPAGRRTDVIGTAVYMDFATSAKKASPFHFHWEQQNTNIHAKSNLYN